MLIVKFVAFNWLVPTYMDPSNTWVSVFQSQNPERCNAAVFGRYKSRTALRTETNRETIQNFKYVGMYRIPIIICHCTN
jgi:hypothetical protein